jgi:RNA polymerase sigma-70 factor (ECF subfamily)
MKDPDLIRRIAQRDDCALSELMARTETAVRRRIIEIVRDSAAADDLTQETFLRVWSRAEQFQGSQSAAGWLGRIATNLALNHLREKRRRPVQARNADEATDPAFRNFDGIVNPAAFDPLEWAVAADLEEQLHEVLDRLPAEKRMVHQMVASGVELRAVAEELGIPIGTAKSRLHYTRKHLTEAWLQLAQQWEDI